MGANINPANPHKTSSTTCNRWFKLTGNKCHPFGAALALTCSIISEVGGVPPPFIWTQISIYNKTYLKRDGRRLEKKGTEKPAYLHPGGYNAM